MNAYEWPREWPHMASLSSRTHDYLQAVRPVSQRTYNMSDGATYSEQILECARRNNVELLASIQAALGEDARVAELINSTKEVISGNSPMHIATALGNWEFLDAVLDVEGVEIDPLNRDGDTPLHLAVKYAADEPDHGLFIIDNLVDAGSDPRVVDKHGLKPVNYVRENPQLREVLESAEYAFAAPAAEPESDDDAGADASASDSD